MRCGPAVDALERDDVEDSRGVDREREVLVDRADRGRALADGRGDPLGRSGPEVADGEQPGPARLVGQGPPPGHGPFVAQRVEVECSIGEHEPVLVDGDAIQPAAVRFGPDEREQRGARHVDLGLRSDQRHPLEGRLAVQRGDGGADVDLDAGMGLDAIDEVRRHRGFQGPTHDDAHRRALLGEVHRGLAGRVPPADDDGRRPGAPARLELGGRVVHAGHLVALEAVDRELPVVRAGGRDERRGRRPACRRTAWPRRARRRRRARSPRRGW